MILGIATVSGLVVYSGQLKRNPDSFLRLFPPHPVIEGDSISLHYNSFYFAGHSSQAVYFGNYIDPSLVVELDLVSFGTREHRLSISKRDFNGAKLEVDFPFFYLLDGVSPRIVRGDLNSWSVTDTLSDEVYFRKAIHTRSQNFVVQSLGVSGENTLGLVSQEFPNGKMRSDILEKQLDGIFCTDGELGYSNETERIVYSYYYRNEFIVMDSDLDILFRGRTLDTTRSAQIKVTVNDDTGVHELASPPYFVNYKARVDGPWLFIQSLKVAKNEPRDLRETSSVIDVYRIDDGSYYISLVIYHFLGTRKMTDFYIAGDKLLVQYGELVRIFSMRPEFFSPDGEYNISREARRKTENL